jgi:putative transposase
VAKAVPVRPIDVPDKKWAEAVRREPAIRRLAAVEKPGRRDVDAVARELGLSRSQVYRLMHAFRENPITQSLVFANPGPGKGTSRLPSDVEKIIEGAIDTDYNRRERPTVQHLLREIRARCRAAGFKPPSRKAVSARVARRSPRDVAARREGAKWARNHLALVRPGLRPSAPLEILQIDHTKVDTQLVDERTRQPLGRPWVTLLLDVFSRAILEVG